MSSNLENQLADAMMVIQMLIANVGNLTQQVVHLIQNMALMQANQNFPPPASIPQPSPTFTPISTTTTTISAWTGPGPGNTHAFLFMHREPKIATSLPFSGKRDNTESFINRCCLCMNGWKLEFPDEDAKIYWILSYMQTGSAKIWHNYIVTLMYKGQQLFSTSDELLKEIDWKFRDMDKRTTQSLKIRTIQQGDRLVDEHVQEFEKAALEAGYKGYPLIVEFKCLLNSGLRRRLMELRPMPMTIQQWYDKAITMDHQ